MRRWFTRVAAALLATAALIAGFVTLSRFPSEVFVGSADHTDARNGPEGLRVRLIDIATGKPAAGQELELQFLSRPRTVFIRAISGSDGVARFALTAPVAGEFSAHGPLSSRNVLYLGCEWTDRLMLDDVLKHGLTMTTLAPWCSGGGQSPPEVQAAPGEIVMFVRSLTWRDWIDKNYFPQW